MAELGYILKGDLLKEINADTLTELTGGKQAIGSNIAVAGNDSVWKNNVKGAVDYVQGYTRHWYDMEAELRSIKAFNLIDTFVSGDRIANTADSLGFQTIYKCKLESTGNVITDTDFFEEYDDRENRLVEIVCIIIIYNLSRRYNPRQIPEQRQIDYDVAIKDLEKIQKGIISLNIAERSSVTSEDPGFEQIYGDFDNVTQDLY